MAFYGFLWCSQKNLAFYGFYLWLWLFWQAARAATAHRQWQQWARRQQATQQRQQLRQRRQQLAVAAASTAAVAATAASAQSAAHHWAPSTRPGVDTTIAASALRYCGRTQQQQQHNNAIPQQQKPNTQGRPTVSASKRSGGSQANFTSSLLHETKRQQDGARTRSSAFLIKSRGIDNHTTINQNKRGGQPS
jgi:hypothetical protein